MTIKDKYSRIPGTQTKLQAKKARKSDNPDSSNANVDRFKDRWAQLNGDVKTAVCYWNDLTQKYDGKMNRDQEQLHEIKSLLKELQKKIKVFND